MTKLVISPLVGESRLMQSGTSPDATFLIQGFRRLKSALMFLRHQLRAEARSMNFFGCVINYGLKSAAWFVFVKSSNHAFMPLALASG